MGAHGVYNVAFERILKRMATCFPITSGEGMKFALRMKMEFLVHSPFVYLPVYFACKSYFLGQSPVEGLRSYVQNFWGTYTKCMSVWVPAHFVTFGILPVHLRITWIAM